ncbi:zinc-dependent alcohol dehydrogenase family protein [Anaeromyxobacter paludicola]|nr:zinc-dependent alcohol dehydrogenase family protein [Anaeromyxobacter paludicola]
MRAAVLSRFGGPENLELKDVEKPAPGPGQLLVRVICASVNPVDAKLRHDGSWAGLSPPVILGYDASGVVAGAGPGATRFKPGDEVYYTPEIFGNPHGSYAEYEVVPEAIVAPKPAGLGHAQAASMPLAGGTAYEALVRRLRVQVGEVVLVHGGAGGVGSFAVQIARAAGCRVIATAGPENQSTLHRLGADHCLDYTGGGVAKAVLELTGGRGVDAVFSTAGGQTIAESLPVTRPGGRLATILGPGVDLDLLYPRNLTLHGVFLTREAARLEELGRLAERGQVRPLVEAVLPLEQVADAHRRMDSGHGRGKLVLQVAQHD